MYIPEVNLLQLVAVGYLAALGFTFLFKGIKDSYWLSEDGYGD